MKQVLTRRNSEACLNLKTVEEADAFWGIPARGRNTAEAEKEGRAVRGEEKEEGAKARTTL